MENENYLSINDLCLATTISLSFPLMTTHRVDGKVFFNFKKSSELEQFLSQYWSDQISTEPKRFFQQIKLLKNYIYGGGND
jgi:hypothetical protein